MPSRRLSKNQTQLRAEHYKEKFQELIVRLSAEQKIVLLIDEYDRPITDLLEKFGQGGNCTSHGNTIYYHNSFIIANAEEAWVLETVDKQWAAKKIKDVYSISNCYTLGSEYDMVSSNLVDLAIQKGITNSTNKFHFAKDYSDFIITTFGKGLVRREITTPI